MARHLNANSDITENKDEVEITIWEDRGNYISVIIHNTY